MLRNIFLKELRDRRRSLLFWTIGLLALCAIMMAFYPTIRDSPAISQYIESFPEEFMAFFGGELMDYTTPTGYLNAEMFSMMVPLLLLVFLSGRLMQVI